MKTKFQTRKRIFSLIMVLAILIGYMPRTTLVAEAVDHKAGAIVYFQKPDSWGDQNIVKLATGHNNWSSVYSMEHVEGTNWYRLTMPDWDGATYCAVFVDGSEALVEGSWGYDKIEKNASYYTAKYENYGFNNNYYYIVPSNNSTEKTPISITYKENDLRPLMNLTSVTAVGNGSGNWLKGVSEWEINGSNHMTKGDDGVWRITYNDVEDGNYEFKFVANDSWDVEWGGTYSASGQKTSASLSGGNIAFKVPYETAKVTLELDLSEGLLGQHYFTVTVEDANPTYCTVKLHFLDGANWGSVYGYALNGTTGTKLMGDWPGTALTKDKDGYYTMEIKANVVEDLNYIFNNGSSNIQTVDLKIESKELNSDADKKIELWVQTDGSTDTNGKYNCSINESADDLIISPEINGNQVTFRYKGNGSSVSVAGSFNNWNQVAMTTNEKGVWEKTIKFEPGSYQYKFVVDGTYIADPLGNTMIGGDGNSLVVVPASDATVPGENEIKLEVHYSRADKNYDKWNAYSWGSSAPGSEMLFNINETKNDAVTTFSYPSARANTSITIAVRKGNWDEKACEEKIDIQDILSGTIYVYVSTDANGRNKVSYAYGTDVVRGNKVITANIDYDNNAFIVKTAQSGAIELYKDGTKVKNVTISTNDKTHTIQLSDTINLKELHTYTIRIAGDSYKIGDKTYVQDYKINVYDAYESKKFEDAYTYNGDDLGATWSEESTTFKVWAPTAIKVSVALYKGGTAGIEDGINDVEMKEGDQGVWVATVDGNLHDTYYTYKVTVGGQTIEACDPYARTTGVNGQRAMVVNLDGTNPNDWNKDKGPNDGMNYTDAIIYELHVRDFSIDESSGITNKGKYLGLTETGTKLNGNPEGISTGLDYLKELGITHLHLLPVYDYGSVDESKLDTAQFNWGYDPVNYNVPEGSYSSNPYDGETRVKEFKQMVQALHDADINVVMDVVYNHVYDGAKFCFNQIVPGYFSRFLEDGTYHNGTGCGNDTASEHLMVRKYIVDSVVYWAKEYHIDGFRFDLVGILDAETVRAIVTAAHQVDEDILFYGEGWSMAWTSGMDMATQQNYDKTPEFGYFSDGTRSMLTGENNATQTGFASGNKGKEEALYYRFIGTTDYSGGNPIPTQVVNYASCHDNYALWDKLILTTPHLYDDPTTEKDERTETRIKMNNLAAAIYMLSEGIPFIHAGEEMLRSKPLGNGKYEHNSYKSSDEINSIKWERLETYADVSEYYEGLIEFRKNHAALRLTDANQITSTISTWYHDKHENADGKLMIIFDGSKIEEEVADKIAIIFNNDSKTQPMNLPDGTWTICINDEKAGIESLGTVSNGSVNVPAYSAMVLVQGKLEDTGSVYDDNEKDDINIESNKEKLLGYTISLKGNIAINYYMELSEEAIKDTGAYMLFTLPNGETTKVLISEATQKEQAGVDAYVFSCEVAAKEMTKDVTAQMVFSDGTKGEVYTYNVKKYADYILKNATDANLKTLVTNMLHYGAYAQTFFEYNIENMANKDLAPLDMSNINSENENLKTYAVPAQDVVSGFKYIGSSLILESETTLRVWFELSQGQEDASYTVKLGDKTMTLNKRGAYYYVDITNISAQNLDTKYKITVSDGNASGELDISALTYCYSALKIEGTKMNLQNVVKSMYLYNQAANTYFNDNQGEN